MSGLFQSLEIGKNALLSQQFSLQTISHNIANSDTPGYTRQRVVMSTSYPQQSNVGMIGSGVQVDTIVQIRDLFLGQQYRDAQMSYGEWAYKEKIYTQIESVFNEPNDNSLNDLLNNFWDSWSQLATNSDSSDNREVILAQANQLINGFQQMAWSLESLRESIDSDITSMTYEINNLTTEIANLNAQIQVSELGGVTANDLRDARDLLLDELSNFIDVNTIEQPNSSTSVYIGSMVLVDGTQSFDINTVTVNDNGQPINRLIWAGSEVELRNNNGQLSGLLEMRDQTVVEYQKKLDEMAATLVTEVNALHRSGYAADGSTSVNFFDPNYTTASTIRLNSEIETDTNKIVASQGQDSDNLIALAIYDLRDVRIMSSG
ncbi:MAG: flagellar hook-associated protein FlgK, partial [Candidatus Zixiibacteriota bacterium]